MVQETMHQAKILCASRKWNEILQREVAFCKRGVRLGNRRGNSTKVRMLLGMHKLRRIRFVFMLGKKEVDSKPAANKETAVSKSHSSEIDC